MRLTTPYNHPLSVLFIRKKCLECLFAFLMWLLKFFILQEPAVKMSIVTTIELDHTVNIELDHTVNTVWRFT